ncbi:MAG: hypothetical protein A3F74_07920 [Betaproteobacteria bacterium RIFCSPLOWO2_12_FULL_62_58]|nr:MAG: hypothetical protein A3F74_07920 [Betaproteobacteria bacterium RIFCSPLOWO2_12_FULL_62_58]
MPEIKAETDSIDWSLTTWKGARREQLRRWSELSLEEIIRAQEEMREISEWLAQIQTPSDRDCKQSR